MKDKVFGEIVYVNNAWRKKMELSLDGHDYEIELRIEDNNKDGILDIQREAFNVYQKNLDSYTQEVPNILVDHYKWYFEAIRKSVTLDEDTQKETITTPTMLDIVMATYLCITRNGEFGWVFACSWNNGFAVLLSEGNPRVITIEQMLNLHKLNDPTFGLLIHDGYNSWKGLEQNRFYGDLENLEIEVSGSVEDGISPIQVKTYQNYLQNKEKLFKDLTRMMLSIYFGDEKKVDAVMGKEEVSEIVQAILPKTLCIDQDGNYGWICYTQWDDSYIGVLLSDDKPQFMQYQSLQAYNKKKKVKDDVFGILFPDYRGFEKTIVVRLAGEVHTLPLTVRTDDGVLTNEMRDAYKHYLKLSPTLWEGIKDSMLKHYVRGYDTFSTFMELPKELSKEKVNRDNVMSIVKFTELYISDEGVIAWLCECPIAEEEGLAFEFTDGNIEAIAQSDII